MNILDSNDLFPGIHSITGPLVIAVISLLKRLYCINMADTTILHLNRMIYFWNSKMQMMLAWHALILTNWYKNLEHTCLVFIASYRLFHRNFIHFVKESFSSQILQNILSLDLVIIQNETSFLKVELNEGKSIGIF